MIPTVLRILQSGRWACSEETLDHMMMQSLEPAEQDLFDLFTLIRQDVAVVVGRVNDRPLYRIEHSGYARFEPDMDDQLRVLFPRCAELVLQHRRNLSEIREEGLSPDDAFSELVKFHRLVATYDNDRGAKLTCVLRKDVLVSVISHDVERAQIWFYLEKFQAWLGDSPFSACLEAYSGSFAPVVYLANLSGNETYDTFIVPLQPDSAPPSGAEKYPTAYANKLSELTAVTNAPIIHPSRFYGLDFARWAPFYRLRELAAYSALCLFASSVVRRGDSYTFHYRVPGGVRTTDVHFANGCVSNCAPTMELSPSLLMGAYQLCATYGQSLADSSSYRKVWEVVLEATAGDSLLKVLTDPEAINKAFRDLREKVLDDNVGKVITTHEKAQTTVLQVSGQITKDIDGLGGDVEKALFAGIGSGVLSLLGAYAKVQSLDLAAPVTAAFLATLFFPTVYGRVQYLRDSIASREADLDLFLKSLVRQCADLVDLTPYRARFDEHKSLADGQISAAESRITALFAIVHLIAAVGVFLVINGTASDIAKALVPFLVSVYSFYVVVRVPDIPFWLQLGFALTPVAIAINLALQCLGLIR